MEKVNKTKLTKSLKDIKKLLEKVCKLDNNEFLKSTYDEIDKIDSYFDKGFVNMHIRFMNKIKQSIFRLDYITKHEMEFISPIYNILDDILTDINTKPVLVYRSFVLNSLELTERFIKLITKDTIIKGFNEYETEIMLTELNSILDMCYSLIYNEKYYTEYRKSKNDKPDIDKIIM